MRQSFDNTKKTAKERNSNNYSMNENEKNFKRNNSSSYMLGKTRSPNATSHSFLAGQSLQSRPLIGSQLVKHLKL